LKAQAATTAKGQRLQGVLDVVAGIEFADVTAGLQITPWMARNLITTGVLVMYTATMQVKPCVH
jgi:hypothetical protein